MKWPRQQCLEGLWLPCLHLDVICSTLSGKSTLKNNNKAAGKAEERNFEDRRNTQWHDISAC